MLTLVSLLMVLLTSFMTKTSAEDTLLTSNRIWHLISLATFTLPSNVLDPRGSRSMLAFGLSVVLLIEVFQPVFGGIASGIDILAGILGLALGAIVGILVRRCIF